MRAILVWIRSILPPPPAPVEGCSGDSRNPIYFSIVTVKSTGGGPMRLVTALFIAAVVATAATGFGFSVWHDGFHRDTNVRVIHYDTNYDLSAQRRVPAERLPVE